MLRVTSMLSNQARPYYASLAHHILSQSTPPQTIFQGSTTVKGLEPYNKLNQTIPFYTTLFYPTLAFAKPDQPNPLYISGYIDSQTSYTQYINLAHSVIAQASPDQFRPCYTNPYNRILTGQTVNTQYKTNPVYTYPIHIRPS